MTTIILISVMTLYFIAALLILKWTVSLVRSQHMHDLSVSREALLTYIRMELSSQESRLSERSRALK